MSASCQIPETGIATPLLQAIDCQITSYVETVYSSLFGPVGWLGPALTISLTLYIAFFALQLITGRASLNLSGLVPRLILIAFVLTFATRWPTYQALVFDVLFEGAEELSGHLVAENALLQGDPRRSVTARLDRVLSQLALSAGGGDASAWSNKSMRPRTVKKASESIQAASTNAVPLGAPTAYVLWLSIGIIALGSIGILIVAKVLLGILLAVGPIFIVLSLFAATRGLFEGWLRSVLLYALIPVFSIVLTAGVLNVVEPLAADISQDGSSARAIFLLLVVAVVFGMLIVQASRMAGQICGAWEITTQNASPAESSSRSLEQLNSATASETSSPRLVSMLSSLEEDSRGHVAAAAAGPQRTDLLGLDNFEPQRAQFVASKRSRLGQSGRATGLQSDVLGSRPR